jgi:hypothetical protein
MSDVVRGAEHVVVLAGNPDKPQEGDPLKQWGSRVWTFPEIILAKGDDISVYDHGRLKRISKSRFPSLAWSDSLASRQLLENFTTLHLSRLELLRIATECLMNRELNLKHAGDRSYALMGLFRIRPQIDCQDSSFQAFAR